MSEESVKPRRKRKKRRKRRKQASRTTEAEAALELISNHTRENAMTVLRHQRYLGLGATIAIVGLAMVGTHASKAGSLVVIVGLLLLIGSVHRFGRLGTERLARNRH